MAGLMMSPTLPGSRCAFTAGRTVSLQHRHPALAARSRTPLCVEAKRSKAADFRGLSQEQIAEQVDQAKRELFILRFKQKTREVQRRAWSTQPEVPPSLPFSTTFVLKMYLHLLQEFKTSEFPAIKLKVSAASRHLCRIA